MLLSLVTTGCNGNKDKKAGKTSHVVEASAPGSATLQFSGQKAKTTVKKVSFKKQAIPDQDFTKAAKGQSFLVFDIQIENVGKLASVGGGYSLKLPGGRTLRYTGVADGEKAIPFELLEPGQSKRGTLSWEVPAPKRGQKFVLLWKPNPNEKKEARFTYSYKPKN